MKQLQRHITDYLGGLGVEVLSIRKNRHAVWRCRRGDTEFTLITSVTPKNDDFAFRAACRDIRKALKIERTA